MCGIAGIISLTGAPVDGLRLERMTSVLAHRGPDDAGYVFAAPDGKAADYVEAEFQHISPTIAPLTPSVAGSAASHGYLVGFGHRRLGIIAPGPEGHQPMPDQARRRWIVYNGETYNYRELRDRQIAAGHQIRSASDTEVVLNQWNSGGIDGLLDVNGMFAFAIYDSDANEAVLGRDRFGVKPLYWAITGEYLVFASEIKSLFASGLVTAELDPAGVAEYCTFQNVLRNETIWQGVNLLPAGHVLRLRPGAGESPTSVEYHRGYGVGREMLDPDPAELADAFDAAVTRQLVSDVHVGSFLSGGMDSGSIVAVAGRSLPRLHTFTGGFDMTNISGVEQGNDERHLAEELSYLLQTEHYSVVLKSGDMPAVMDKLTWHMDDPRAGMCYPNWYTSKLASKFVKVCMAGTGGDELFGGYPWRYRAGVQAESRDDFVEKLFASWHRLVPANEMDSLLSGDVACHLPQVRDGFNAISQRAIEDSPGVIGSPQNLMEAVLRFEFKTFLNGLLVTDDHVSMAHSLETRVPFLDNELSDLAWKLPSASKFDIGVLIANPTGFLDSVGGKLLLRSAMSRHLPETFTRQKKQGFSPPDENWYRGESLDYVKEVLFDQRTIDRPWFNQNTVRTLVEQHVSGERNNRLAIWSLISLEYIQRHFVDG
jgi:asparagine synthase (glutamine-hydrolysing)